MAHDLLSLLANKSNQSILGLLAVEEAWPRKVASLISLTETEVSRRLKRMEDLGLVRGEWSHVGKNVKLYRLAVKGAHVHFTQEGVEYRLEAWDGTAQPTDLTHILTSSVPDMEGFVGREEALAALDQGPGVVLVEGIPGIGKTSLLAAWARHQPRPVFWHGFRGAESLRWLVNRAAVFHARHGRRRWVDALGGDIEPADLAMLLAEMCDEPEAIHILDDIHTIEDPALREALHAAIGTTHTGSLILASRGPVRHDPTLAHVHTLRLEGLGDEDVARLLALRGVEVEHSLLPRIRAEVGGHPLAIGLLVAAAERLDIPLTALLDRVPEKEVEEWLLQEVYEGLGEDERQVLTQASIFRTRFSADDLRAITRKDPEHTLLRLRRRLLVEANEDGYLLHEIVSNHFYQRLHDKERLHGALAERYAAEDTPEGRLEAMSHFQAAGRRDRVLELLEEDLDLRAFDFLDPSLHTLYAEVLESFTRADVKDPRRWAVILDDRGDIAYHRGSYEEALVRYQEAEEAFSAAQEDGRVADLQWKRGLALRKLGRQEEAQKAVAAGLAVAPAESRTRERLEELRHELETPLA